MKPDPNTDAFRIVGTAGTADKAALYATSAATAYQELSKSALDAQIRSGDPSTRRRESRAKGDHSCRSDRTGSDVGSLVVDRAQHSKSRTRREGSGLRRRYRLRRPSPNRVGGYWCHTPQRHHRHDVRALRRRTCGVVPCCPSPACRPRRPGRADHRRSVPRRRHDRPLGAPLVGRVTHRTRRLRDREHHCQFACTRRRTARRQSDADSRTNGNGSAIGTGSRARRSSRPRRRRRRPAPQPQPRAWSLRGIGSRRHSQWPIGSARRHTHAAPGRRQHRRRRGRSLGGRHDEPLPVADRLAVHGTRRETITSSRSSTVRRYSGRLPRVRSPVPPTESYSSSRPAPRRASSSGHTSS